MPDLVILANYHIILFIYFVCFQNYYVHFINYVHYQDEQHTVLNFKD